MTPTLTKQFDLSPADIRLRARNIVLSGVALSCALLPLGHWLSSALPPVVAVLVPAMTSVSNLILIVAVATALMRTLGELSDDALLEKVKETNSALVESEERFRTLFESNIDGLMSWSVNADGTHDLDSTNPAFLEMFGLNRDTAPETIRRFAHFTDASQEDWVTKHQQTLNDFGYIREFDFDGLKSDGTQFPVRARAWHVKDSHGRVTGLWICCRDISTLKQTEQDLRIKDRALEQSSVAIAITDESRPNDISVYLNPAFERMTGYSARDFDGQMPIEYIADTAADRTELDRALKAYKNGEPYQARVSCLKKNGERFLRDIESSPVRDDSGQITHWINISQDVTQKVEDEQQLRLFKRAVEQSTNAIVITRLEADDQGYQPSYVNPAFEMMSGFTLDDIRAFDDPQSPPKYSKFFNTPDQIEALKQFGQAFLKGEPIQARVWMATKSGPPQLRDVQCSPVRNEAGEVTHQIAIHRDVTQEVKDQQELHLFKRAMEQSPAAIAIVEEQDGEIPRVAFVNDSIERMHGFSKGAITGKSASLFVSEGWISSALADSMKEARMRGEAIDADGYFKKPDGSDGWLSLRYAPVRDASDTITHWISYGIDITEQFDAERIQRRNSLILGQLSESLFVADLNGQTIDCNSASEETLGRNLDDIIGHRLSDFSPAPKLQNAKIHHRSKNSGADEDFVDEIPVLRNDGQEILLETVSKRWFGDDGQPEGWITVGRDITKKRAAEEELRILKRAIEQSPTSITISEAQENGAPHIIFNNEAAGTMYGLAAKDMVGQEATTFVMSHMIAEDFSQRLTAARSRGEAIDTSGSYIRADGAQGWMNARYAPVRDEKNEITHWVAFGTDTTEQYQAEQQRRILERALEYSPTAVSIIETLPDKILQNSYVNGAFEKMTGYARDDILNQPYSPLSAKPSTDTEGFLARNSSESTQGIDQRVRSDGSTYMREYRSAAVQDEQGTTTHYIVLSNDITARIEDEQRLRKLQLAFEQADSAIAIWDFTPGGTRMAYMNAAYEQMTGYSAEELLDKPPEKPINRNASDTRLSEIWNQVIKTGAAATIMTETQRKDGRWFLREIEVNPILDSAGTAISLVGISRDITEKRANEQRLQKLQLAVEQADSAIALWDVSEDGPEITYINDAYEQMTGYRKDELVGRPPDTLVTRRVNETDAVESWDTAMGNGESVTLTTETQRKDGTWFTRETEISRLKDSNGAVFSSIGISRDITQKRAYEQRLSSLQMAFEQADSAISIMTVAKSGNTIAFVNGAYEKMMGYTRDEVIGTTAGFLKNRDFLEPRGMEKWIEAIRQGQSVSLTIETQRKDGSWFVRDVESNPVRNSKGAIISWISVSRNVTQKLQDEQRLRTLQLAFDQTDSAISIMATSDSGHIFSYVNQAFETMSGYSRKEVIGSRSDFLENRDFIEVGAIDRWRNSLQQGESAALTLETKHKDGSWFVREMEANPVRGSDGAIVSWIGVSRDVTQKLKDEQRLRRDALILETLSEAVTITDPDGVFLDCNKGAETLFGYTKEELIGKPTEFILKTPKTQNLEHSARVERARDGKATEGSDTILRKDGEERLIELVAAPFLSSDGTFLGHVTVSRDITEKRALHEQLQHVQKMEAVGQLTGGIAHDFNNLMGVISGSLQLIQGEQEDWEFVHQMAHTADKSVMRGKDLVDRMLSFSRRQTLNPVETDVAELMDGTVDLLRRSIGDRINITLEYDDGLPHCLLDQAQFESAILNMSLNARDAMEPGGHLTISAQQTNAKSEAEDTTENHTYVCVTIADDGTGMDDETLAKIYEPFFTTKDVGEGSGLGLSMVYGFVKQSGGHVEVESTPGEGTRFSLFFPAMDKLQAGRVEALEASSNEASKGQGRILVVEDNAEMMVISRHSLTRMGYDVVTADTATTAMTQLTDNPDIKIAFIDIMLPDGMTGTELAKLLISVRPELRVLFTSGYSDPSILKDAMDISQVIRKPFTLQELEDALGGLVEARKRLH